MKREIIYKRVPEANPFMTAAKAYALAHATDRQVPVGAVLVYQGKIIFSAANTGIKNKIINDFHVKKMCVRRILKIPSGRYYWLCPACVKPQKHPEQQIIAWARENHIDLAQCDLYLWGHHTCCPSCTQKILSTDLSTVYVCEDCERFRN